MLHNIDTKKLNTLMRENNDVKKIIMQLMDNHYEIVSMISHEIRNPMTLISSSAQLMELKDPKLRQQPGWVQMRNDIDFVCRLLNEISSMLGGNFLRYSTFSMENLLKNIALSFAMTLDHENPKIEFTSEISSNLGEFTGDSVKLEEMILNLLINAKDSITEAGQIRLSCDRDEKYIIIRCEDSGCGISDEQKATIFDPFITYKTNGTGLGLPFCKKIAEAHKGSIEVKSSLKGGSSFMVRLPIQ